METPSPPQAISSRPLPPPGLQSHDLRHTENNLATTKPTEAISTTISRNETVRALWKRVQEVRVVHIQGTPGSGKSTLAQLLRLHVEDTSDMEVVSLSWPTCFPENLSTVTMYYKLLNTITGRQQPDLNDWLDKRILLIIDETQRSYAYSSFWNDFIKSINPGAGPCVALFSSSGYSTRCPPGQPSTPVILRAAQKISLNSPRANSDIGLGFSREEYDELVRKVCSYHQKQQGNYLLSNRLIDYIWGLTSGHPAAGSPEYQGRTAEFIVAGAWERFSDDSFFLDCIEDSATHSICWLQAAKIILAENSNISQYLAKAVVYSGSVARAGFNGEIERCYREGWLQSEFQEDGKRIYIFPSYLHRRYFEHILSRNIAPFPFNRYESIESLSFSILECFQQDRLKVHSKSSTLPQHLKAYFRNEFYYEFYCACYELFGEQQLYLASEWTGKMKAHRADFQVRGTPWAIEIITAEDDTLERVDRFKAGGIYSRWLKKQGIEQYIILDCGMSAPVEMTRYNHVCYVEFDKDYGTCQWYNPNTTDVRRIDLSGA
ncbi:hypothetical protein EMPG_12482 [Blastomyces silverae]|uniref:Uncharacterized protein n=1 Tax=Blastomyces silverae TaxID=2060906 RepID=A0A0H1BLV2_9EURO|nr:hypothetical protein EMPG_12482 [Blastomyces silverae]